MTQCGGQIANSDLVRQLNSALVYRLLDQQGVLSRMQIAEQSQLAPASVSKITRQLLARGLIAEQEQQASTGGRRAISLVKVTRPFHSIALQLGRKSASVALYNLAGQVLAQGYYPLSAGDQVALERALLAVLDDFSRQQRGVIEELIAIAIIAPGLVLEQQGIIDYMPHVAVSRWQLAQCVQRHCRVSCFVGHDIRSMTLAEHYFGSLRDCDDGILLRVDQGTGAGILSGGHIFTGRNGNVAEIGHIQVDPLGKRCHCGNFGCLETVAAHEAIEQRVRQLLMEGYPSCLQAEDCTMAAICQAVNQADPLARAVLGEVAEKLGQVLAVAVNLLNPQKVVIAGEITTARQWILPIIDRCLQHQALPAFRQQLQLDCAALDHRSQAQGCAPGAFALVKRAMLNGVLLQRLLDKTV